METVRKPAFKIVYDGKDITQDITGNVVSISYTDNDEKEADEIEISVEDVEAFWRNSWYPKKGSVIKLAIGFDDAPLTDCGNFDIDEVTLQGPPDVIVIRGIAAGFQKGIRTKQSRAFENQTLKQIVNKIAIDNGLTVVGKIADIKFVRKSSNRITDLNFLANLADEYGYKFSIRDNKLIFISVFEIEAGQPVLSIDRKQLKSYSIKDKTSETYKDANVAYSNPTDGTIKQSKVETLSNKDNVTYKQISTNDSLEIRTKAETPAQAEAKGNAALHKKNSRQREGNFSTEGQPTLLAGNNFTLTGLGELAGKYYIKKSNHRIDKGSGYTTTCDIKQITGDAEKSSTQQSAGKEKSYQVQNLTNKDAVTYKQITPN